MQKICYRAILALLIAVLLLPVFSWVISSAYPQWHIHSLLSEEGIRWMYHEFAYTFLSLKLYALILLIIAVGAVQYWNVTYKGMVNDQQTDERGAKIAATGLFCIIICIPFVLAIRHEGPLRTVEGDIWSLYLLNSILLMAAFASIASSWIYGVLTGKIKGSREILGLLTFGLKHYSVLLIFYLLVMLIYHEYLFMC